MCQHYHLFVGLVSNCIRVIEVSYLITTVVIISTCWYQYSANFLRNCSSMHIENTCLYQEKETLGVDDNNCAVLSIYCLHTPYNSFLFLLQRLHCLQGDMSLH